MGRKTKIKIFRRKNKETAVPESKKKNVDLYISITSLVFSVVLTIVSIFLTININQFTKKMSPLNYDFSLISPIDATYNDLVEEGIINGEKKKDGNIPFTISECKLNPIKDNISGEYIRIMFAVKYNTEFDIISLKRNQTELEYGFKDKILLYMIENSSDMISFYFSSTSVLSDIEYDIFHVILQGYNGEFQVFSILYSTSNFNSIIIDSNNIHTLSMYDNFITNHKISISCEEISKNLIEEREQLISSLNV